MLAAADLILVSADSVSMIGEAVATGAPVHIFAPSGGSPKIKLFLERLQSEGAVRPWTGTPESWSLRADQRDAQNRRGDTAGL